VLSYWRIADTETELAIRRIKRTRDMIKFPVEHKHIIALLCGRARFEVEDTSVLDEVGHLRTTAPRSLTAWQRTST
jgi:hypothetical protein